MSAHTIAPPPAHGRRHGPPRRAVFGVLTILLLLGAWWLYDNWPRLPAGVLIASGTIEADEVALAAELSGQLLSVEVREGQSVTAGQKLATLDTALLQAQQRQAQAAVEVARANAALVEAGSREEDQRQLQAVLQQAAATRDGATVAWENAKSVLASPQDLNARVAVARPQVAAAQARLDQLRAGATEQDRAAAKAALAIAQARFDQAVKGMTPEQLAVLEQQLKIARNQEYLAQQNAQELSYRTDTGTSHSVQTPLFSKGIGDAQMGIAYENTKLVEAQLASAKSPPTTEQLAQLQGAVDQAAAQLAKLEQGATPEQLRAAEADVATAQANLDSLLEMQQGSQSLRAQADASYAQYQTAEAAVAAAQARLDAAKNGATKPQLAVARAQVSQAEAALGVLEAQLAKATIMAPAAGVVLKKLINPGEQVAPGGRLLQIANLDEVHLVVYIAETRYGKLALGQQVEVTVDSFPGRTFAGKVIQVADQAEYTPRNVQSSRERANTVFAIKIALPNPDHALKPGMPADARLKL